MKQVLLEKAVQPCLRKVLRKAWRVDDQVVGHRVRAGRPSAESRIPASKGGRSSTSGAQMKAAAGRTAAGVTAATAVAAAAPTPMASAMSVGLCGADRDCEGDNQEGRHPFAC
jgi:hypothetical protein